MYMFMYIFYGSLYKCLGLILEDLTKINVLQVNLPRTEERPLGFSVYIHLLHVFHMYFCITKS